MGFATCDACIRSPCRLDLCNVEPVGTGGHMEQLRFISHFFDSLYHHMFGEKIFCLRGGTVE